jgi:uncharacterized protein
MRFLRSKNYHRMPWKNGGGESCEIAAFPETLDVDGFGWRISMAVVASDGPFSIFPSVDRTLTILDGDGLLLTVGEQMALLLDHNSEPLTFPADIATSASLTGGAVTDLNVMTRRGAFIHRVQRLECHEALWIELSNDVSAIFCATGTVDISWNGRNDRLEPKDCALSIDAVNCILQGDGQVYLITIKPDDNLEPPL